MDRYDEIRQLIDSNREIARFADFGDGVSDEWIAKAEAALGFALPEAYKWWLRNYSGGEIGGEEIYSIYCEEFDSVVGGDVVCMYRQRYPELNRVPICHSDVDGVFCFDRAMKSEDGNYPVISEATGKVYAADFLEFLKKRIQVFQ